MNRIAALVGLLLLILPGGCRKPPADSSGTLPDGAGRKPGEEPAVRVLLVENTRQFRVSVSGPYQVKQDQQILAKGSNLPQTWVRLMDGAPPRVEIGQLSCRGSGIEVIPGRAGTLTLSWLGSDGREVTRRYAGLLRIEQSRDATAPAAGGSGGLDAINVVGIESYLPSVLGSELYPGWHLETFRAQAIAARTYALFEMQSAGRSHYDVKATEASQVYKGLEGLAKDSKQVRAVRDTRGIVCTWDSPAGQKVFGTYYSSTCGGLTQNVADCLNAPTIPPLAGGVKCNYCQIAPRYRWGPVRISKSEATELFAQRFPQHSGIGQIRSVTPVSTARDGRPLKLRVEGDGGQAVVDSYTFRLAMGGHRIFSNHCRIIDAGDVLEFVDGRGFGHGVGLCQWGAEGQARLGRKSSEILAFYYPQSRLTRAY